MCQQAGLCSTSFKMVPLHLSKLVFTKCTHPIFWTVSNVNQLCGSFHPNLHTAPWTTPTQPHPAWFLQATAHSEWTVNWWNCDSYLNRHKLKEVQKHGEAGSVNIATVKVEQAQIKELLARFQPEDQWNMDDSALSSFAPPDCGLSQKQMSGKQANKFWITLAFTCSSNGSEKKDLFFIGKSKKPQCFGWQGLITCGFYYCANKMAWMTGALLKSESISLNVSITHWLNLWMDSGVWYRIGAQGLLKCSYCTLDNFSGNKSSMNQSTSPLSMLNLVWHPTSNLLIWGLSAVSRHITGTSFASGLFSRTMLERSINSIY